MSTNLTPLEKETLEEHLRNLESLLLDFKHQPPLNLERLNWAVERTATATAETIKILLEKEQ